MHIKHRNHDYLLSILEKYELEEKKIQKKSSILSELNDKIEIRYLKYKHPTKNYFISEYDNRKNLWGHILVGDSGSGKPPFLNMLSRPFKNYEGSLSWDGMGA